MVGDKIKYECKNCGWITTVRAEWADLKPKRCMNKKCNTSFLRYREALIVTLPENLKEKNESKEETKKISKRRKIVKKVTEDEPRQEEK